MGFIDDESTIASKVGLRQEFTQEHTISHIFEDGLVARAVFETDRVPNLIAHSGAYFLCYTRCNTHSCNTTRLSATNLQATVTVT
jgi:hypothetical protein